VDDVEPVALGEDEALHLRVPAPGLVPEVHTGFEHFLHGDDGHGRRPPLYLCTLTSRSARASVVVFGRVAGDPGARGRGRRAVERTEADHLATLMQVAGHAKSARGF